MDSLIIHLECYVSHGVVLASTLGIEILGNQVDRGSKSPGDVTNALFYYANVPLVPRTLGLSYIEGRD